MCWLGAQVKGWDNRLSLVGETIDCWMGVQRKWMYLESIFVGSDDIRMQLPEEAKRFDSVDKARKFTRLNRSKRTPFPACLLLKLCS